MLGYILRRICFSFKHAHHNYDVMSSAQEYMPYVTEHLNIFMYVSKFHVEVIQIEISMGADHIFVIEERELKMGVWGNIQTQ